MRLPVSQHFKYTSFGVHDNIGKVHSSGRYIGSAEPGVGFFARETASHSYQHFVNDCRKKQDTNYFKMLFGGEPSFEKLMRRVNAALKSETDPEKKRILEAYLTSLTYARTNEHLERIVRAVKNKIKGSIDRSQSSILSHFKNKLSKVEREMSNIQLDASTMCSPEQFERFSQMVAAFDKVAALRHIWMSTDTYSDKYQQVFFDFGIFDFIKSPLDTPIMRDAKGIHYYFYPNYVLKARSSVDFDLIPLRGMEFICNEANLANATDSVSSVAGDIASILTIPALGLTYYFTHMHVVAAFAEAANAYTKSI